MTSEVIRQIKSINNVPGLILPIVCPGCSREGNFTPVGQDLWLQAQGPTGLINIYLGSRLSPSKECATHVFVVYNGQSVLRTFPPGRIDSDHTDVPQRVIKAFDEALTCAANECYIGSAMLIRKTLEAVCDDRGAVAGNLKDRILDLKNKVTLPPDLFDAMDHLRLLGNDAAHIEAKNYDDVGQEEVLTGVALTKEIIKSTYQYKGLLAKLIALKKA